MTSESQDTKTCPFCAETILAAAIKCKYCGETLDTKAMASASDRLAPDGAGANATKAEEKFNEANNLLSQCRSHLEIHESYDTSHGRHALSCIDEALTLSPNNHSYLNIKGQILCRGLGRVDDAISIYEKLVTEAPDEALFRQNLEYEKRDRDKYSRIVDAESHARAQQHYEAAQREWSNIEFNVLGDKTQFAINGIEAIDAAIKINPKCAEYRNQKGLFLLQGIDDAKKALLCFTRASELDPENVTIKQNLRSAKEKAEEGCFVCTVAFKTDTCWELDVFRDFRDQVLLTLPSGRRFVRAYYRYGPGVASRIEGHEYVCRLLRVLLSTIAVIVSRLHRKPSRRKHGERVGKMER